MRPAANQVFGYLPRRLVLGLVGVTIAACGASASAPPASGPAAVVSAPPASASAPAPSAVAAASPSASVEPPSVEPPSEAPSPSPSKGPATAKFAMTGTAGLTGPVTPTEIICGEPSFDGPQILVLGKTGKAGQQVVLFVTAGHVQARVGTGSGTTLKLRIFEGAGVTGFDAAIGATLDTKLTEITVAGTATGSLGALSAVSGSIDCGDQKAGTANLVITGQTPLGSLASTFTGIHVLCSTSTSGTYVGIQALGTAGTTPVLVFVTAGATSLQVAVETKAASSFYSATGAGLVTLVPDGATVGGDVTQGGVKAGETPLVLHVSGDATCGTTVHF